MSDEDNNNPNLLTKKNVLIVAGIIGLGLAVTLFNTGEKKPEQVDVGAKPIEVGSDPVNVISVKDKDASLTVFAKRFETVDQKLDLQQKDFSEREQTLRKEFKNDTNTLKAQLSALSDDVIGLRSAGVEATYQNANKNDSKTIQAPPPMPDSLPDLGMNGGLNFEGLNFNMDAPKPQGTGHRAAGCQSLRTKLFHSQAGIRRQYRVEKERRRFVKRLRERSVQLDEHPCGSTEQFQRSERRTRAVSTTG